MRKVAIIGTNGLPAKYGGFETLCHHLVKNFDTDQDKVIVYCSRTPSDKRYLSFNGAELVYFPFKANGWQSLIYDFVTIVHALFTASDLIVLGFSGAFALPLNRILRRNIIFNLGGIEWQKVRGSRLTAKFEKLIKRFMEGLCVRNSSFIVIDNEAFRPYLVDTYDTQPILVEYGGDHILKVSLTSELVAKYPFVVTKYAITISRAQKDMNIHLIIDAYKVTPDKNLVIVSNWDISDYGRKLFEENQGKYKNIFLLEAIYDQNELDFLRGHSSLYIHTHSLCGTAPSLVEAMSLDLPVVAFDVPTNRSTTENKAFYFKDVSSLVHVLETLQPKDIESNRNDMSEIAERRYRWPRIVSKYQKMLSKSSSNK